jgi:hypothetical protein
MLCPLFLQQNWESKKRSEGDFHRKIKSPVSLLVTLLLPSPSPEELAP